MDWAFRGSHIPGRPEFIGATNGFSGMVENGIDEAMRVAGADEASVAKSVYLIRVVSNHVHVFQQFDLRDSTTQFR
jgi:hypothetical protein